MDGWMDGWGKDFYRKLLFGRKENPERERERDRERDRETERN